MELVTHTLCGIGLSQCSPKWASQRQAIGILVVASLLPDIDIVVAFIDPTSAALERRMMTHSLLLLPILSAVLALLLRTICRSLEFRTIYFLVLLGSSVHVVLDVINAYGVGLLFPISNARFELPLLFIVDPIIIGVLTAALIGVYVCWSHTKVRIWIARLAFVTIAIYIASAFALRHTAQVILDAAVSPAGGGHTFTYLTPEPLAPFRWKGIYADGDAFEQRVIHPLSRRVEYLPRVASELRNPLVVRARSEVAAKEIERLFVAPVWSVHEHCVSVYDLRFRFSLLANKWDPFGFEFSVNNDKVELIETTLGERGRQVVGTALAMLGKQDDPEEDACRSCSAFRSTRIPIHNAAAQGAADPISSDNCLPSVRSSRGPP